MDFSLTEEQQLLQDSNEEALCLPSDQRQTQESLRETAYQILRYEIHNACLQTNQRNNRNYYLQLQEK